MCYRVLKVHSWKFDNSLMFSVWRSDLSNKFLFWNCFGNGSTRVLFLLWMGQSFKNRSSKIYGRQPLKNLKWHGLPHQTISLQFFKGCLPQILLDLFLNICHKFNYFFVLENSGLLMLSGGYINETSVSL